MKSFVIQPKWKRVEYSRNQIIKAGKIIKNTDSSNDEISYANKVIDNWRAAHGYPLHVIYMHLRRIAEKDEKIIVAERLKRLESITSKLKREPSMNLWTMQDLGGCRLIASNIEEVYKFAEQYERSRKRHILKSTDDYIKNPKVSGYRSLHVVYEYRSDSVDTYNKNMLIEVQFRTRLQHLWATAVETMDIFTKEAIKSGQGNESITRFFVLTSAIIAKIENQPLPPNVIDDIDEIVSEIESLIARYNYIDFLSGINVAANYQEQKMKDKGLGYYVLILNYNKRRVQTRYFKPSEFEYANDVYNSIEKNTPESNVDVVMVKVSSFKKLKSAYPNYFTDIGEFVDIIKSYLSIET